MFKKVGATRACHRVIKIQSGRHARLLVQNNLCLIDTQLLRFFIDPRDAVLINRFNNNVKSDRVSK